MVRNMVRVAERVKMIQTSMKKEWFNDRKHRNGIILFVCMRHIFIIAFSYLNFSLNRTVFIYLLGVWISEDALYHG